MSVSTDARAAGFPPRALGARPIGWTSANSLQQRHRWVESAVDDVHVRRLLVRGFEVQVLLLLLAATAVMLGWTVVDVVVRRRTPSDAD